MMTVRENQDPRLTNNYKKHAEQHGIVVRDILFLPTDFFVSYSWTPEKKGYLEMSFPLLELSQRPMTRGIPSSCCVLLNVFSSIFKESSQKK
jgi:hypothetical protein